MHHHHCFTFQCTIDTGTLAVIKHSNGSQILNEMKNFRKRECQKYLSYAGINAALLWWTNHTINSNFCVVSQLLKLIACCKFKNYCLPVERINCSSCTISAPPINLFQQTFIKECMFPIIKKHRFLKHCIYMSIYLS